LGTTDSEKFIISQTLSVEVKNSTYLTLAIFVFSAAVLYLNVDTQIAISDVSASPTISNNTTTVERYIAQKTEMSTSAPPIATPHGKVPHQIIFALPLRNDSMIWTGTVTFTASRPIEIEVLHDYKPTSTIDSEHGEPYHANISQNRTIAISTMTMFSDTPVKVTDTPISTGSLTFTGSALVFHKTSGDPFTVTYTVDAVARSPTD
jgi:hypothetical protein